MKPLLIATVLALAVSTAHAESCNDVYIMMGKTCASWGWTGPICSACRPDRARFSYLRCGRYGQPYWVMCSGPQKPMR